ncbi:MAG: iclR [Solirubrobacterales bacterium]|nr:iclR [Solirubrobacterales bacterium]
MQTIDRIVVIMERVAESPAGLTLSQLSSATGLAPATCHRLLTALGKRRLLDRDETTKRWRPGIGLVRIATSVSPSAGFGPLVDPVLATLRDRWQECFYLANLTDSEVVCVRTVETTDPNRMSVRVPLGRRMALHASAAAKAILADLTAEEARRLLEAATCERITRYTLETPEAVLEDLAATRDRGYAICDQEMELGVAAYAAVIAGPPGEAPRSLCVIGPRERLRARVREGMLDGLLAAAIDLSRAMQLPADPR